MDEGLDFGAGQCPRSQNRAFAIRWQALSGTWRPRPFCKKTGVGRPLPRAPSFMKQSTLAVRTGCVTYREPRFRTPVRRRREFINQKRWSALVYQSR